MARVTAKGQVTIPREIRQALGLGPGSTVRFRMEGNSCIVEKEVTEDVFTRWIRALKCEKRTDEIIEELRGLSALLQRPQTQCG